MKKMIKNMCILFGCLFVLSCGSNLSEQELKNLETQAENGDLEAAIKLRDYYNNNVPPISESEYIELKEKAEHGDVDAQKKTTIVEKYRNNFKRSLFLAADNGDLESAYMAALCCELDFKKGINVKENKRNYRKYMEIAIVGGYKDDTDIKLIRDYKKLYQNQSDEWWNSDSIKTKEQLSK